MEEAQELSNHIGILDHGSLIASGTHGELVKIVGEQDRIELRTSTPAGNLVDVWQQVEGITQITSHEDMVTLLADDSNVILPQLFESAAKAEIRITSVDIKEPNLETVFLHLTGRALRD